VESHNSV
jgi:hypothetical protein